MNTQWKVLVVEDEEHIRVVLEYNLRLDGFDVYLAEDGVKGLRLARQIKPHLILLDWMMPEMNGLAVLSELKNDQQMMNTHVFMLTAKGVSSDKELALSVGADDYIVKPFDFSQLSRMIRERLGQDGACGSPRKAAQVRF
ncbi:MAG TPA: response regulator [Sedimentisphaerales bacterium]|nr:response regulator [Sedimentisphaerales bacterium]